MLRVNPSADAGYYLGSANERESAGEWAGHLAHELGIGSLDHAALRPLLSNRTPEGNRLTPIDQKGRREGYDLTFSEPKSVSIMEQVAGDKRIGQARRDSVDEIMRTLVEPMATTRKGNYRIQTGNLAYLPFDHLLARPENGKPDPNGHTHVVIVNGTSVHRKRNALEVAPIKESAAFIEAAWHALYASKLKDLGYDIRPTKTAFEILGVSDAVIRKFSTRTATVENELERRQQALSEQIKTAKSADELRLLEGRVAKLKTPKGKAALGAQIREKKQPLQDPDVIKADWFSRLTRTEAKTLLELHNKAALGVMPEPELPMGVLGKALTSFKDAMKAAQEIQREPETPAENKSHLYLAQALETALKDDSRVTEERLYLLALKAGVGEVTLPQLQQTLASDHFRDATNMVAAVGQVSTRPALQMEEDVTDYAKKGKIIWLKSLDPSRIDARTLTMPALHELVKLAGDKPVIITGDARGQREGQPLKVLRDLVGMKPHGEPSRAKRPNVVAPALKGWKNRMKAQMSLIRKQWRQPEVSNVRTQEPTRER